MKKEFTLQEAMQKIFERIDVVQLYSEMIDENLIHPKAVTNKNLFNSKGELAIDVDFDLADDNLKEYTMIDCPFHKTDNKYSASLHRTKGTFTCFVADCRTSDYKASKPDRNFTFTVIEFYMVLRYNIDPSLLDDKENNKEAFKETVEDLCKRVGISFKFGQRKLSKQEERELKTQEIRKKAANLYHLALINHPEGKKAYEYLNEQRGFKYGVVPLKALIEAYQMGYAPSKFGWNWLDKLKLPASESEEKRSWLYEQLKHEYTDEELKDAGVVFEYQRKDRKTKRKYGPKYYVDLLTEGVVLPYYSKGQVNNLYSRLIVDTDDDKFRHLRLSGSVDIPINFDVAKYHESLIIVEGELSWLSLVALGYENVIGNRGTNGLSKKHVGMIKNIREKSGGSKCSTIYLAFDPDEPGMKATSLTGKQLVSEGFDVRIIRLPRWKTNKGKLKGDPNDFLQRFKEEAKEKFQELIDQAVTYHGFMISYMMMQAKVKTNADSVAILEKVQPFVDQITPAARIPIAREVASLVNLSEQDLIQAWLYEMPQMKQQKPATESITPKEKEAYIPGIEEAMEKTWICAFDNVKLREQVKGHLNNTVLLSSANVDSFHQKVSEQMHIKTIAFNSNMDKSLKEHLFRMFKDYHFVAFMEKEDIKNGEMNLEDVMKSLKTMA